MSTLLGTVLAFMAAAVQLTPPAAAAAKPNPKTRAEAEALLIEEFIFALHNRPADFMRTEYTLTDRKTKMEWWVASGEDRFHLYRVGGCSCRDIRFGDNENRRRAWQAIEEWLSSSVAQRGDAEPHAHEAIRLWKANASMRKRAA